MNYYFPKIKRISGELELPGDKSISHRAVIFSSMAEGKSKIKNLSNSADVSSTINCFRSLGVNIDVKNEVSIDGAGFKGFKEPEVPLDAGNSGTTARLLSGVLSGQNFSSIIIGDESLSKRPMKRIIDPLKLMGASIEYKNDYNLPLKFNSVNALSSIIYKLPIASAQVKSAVLLAGLHLNEPTLVIEDSFSRDHTERMLGLPIEIKNDEKIITASKEYYPLAKDYFIPSDFSSAAFFIVAGLLIPNSELIIRNILLNESRTGLLKLLIEMGGKISIENIRSSSSEKYGDIIIRSSDLVNVKVDSAIIPNIIDEIPILAVSGIFAKGDFHITGAEELRFKESDRISAVVNNLISAGLTVEEYKDGFKISGEPTINKPVFESYGDHRIAMAFAILSSLLNNGGSINGVDCIRISNPNFINQLKTVSG